MSVKINEEKSFLHEQRAQASFGRQITPGSRCQVLNKRRGLFNRVNTVGDGICDLRKTIYVTRRRNYISTFYCFMFKKKMSIFYFFKRENHCTMKKVEQTR